MQPLDIKDLVVLLRTNAGDSDTFDLDGDVLDVPFDELNYDSLALLQVTGAIERDYDVALDEEALEEAQTPRRYLEVVNQVGYPRPALDPEDLAMAKDGTIWVADIGDNSQASGGDSQRRSTIALWSLAPGSKTPVIHRLAYPDGTARDAETLLMSPNGTPVIVTKEPSGEVYVPSAALQADNKEGVKLKRVGTFTPEKTGTPNHLLFIGSALITGGAVSPDGTKAVIRTMSDAYEFDVSNGDVAGAVTSGKYRITPLPNEPQGEGISYTPDGKNFVTCSDQNGPSTTNTLDPVPSHRWPAVLASTASEAPRAFA